MARRSSHGRLKAEINIVPYIDVMLVLLVIFMVTAPLLNQGVEVDLPKAPAESLDSRTQETEVLVLSVKRDGSCHFNVGSAKAQAVDCQRLEPLRTEIEERLRSTPQPPVLVRGDKQVAYEQIIQAMSALKAVGAAKVGLSTAPPDAAANATPLLPPEAPPATR